MRGEAVRVCTLTHVTHSDLDVWTQEGGGGGGKGVSLLDVCVWGGDRGCMCVHTDTCQPPSPTCLDRREGGMEREGRGQEGKVFVACLCWGLVAM